MYLTMPLVPTPRQSRVRPARRAIRSTLDREQRHRSASSRGERYGEGSADRFNFSEGDFIVWLPRFRCWPAVLRAEVHARLQQLGHDPFIPRARFPVLHQRIEQRLK